MTTYQRGLLIVFAAGVAALAAAYVVSTVRGHRALEREFAAIRGLAVGLATNPADLAEAEAITRLREGRP